MGSGQSLRRRGAGFSVHGYVVPLEYIFLAFLIEFTQREEGIARPDRNLTLGPYRGLNNYPCYFGGSSADYSIRYPKALF